MPSSAAPEEEGVPVSDNAVASSGSAASTSPAEDEVLAELIAPVPEVGDGGPEMVQLLTPEGQRVENAEYDHYLEDLTDEDLRGFYRDLVLIRRVDAEARSEERRVGKECRSGGSADLESRNDQR